MSDVSGEPILGILHSSDASAGVEVPIYNAGSRTARTLASNEYLVITWVLLITAAGGDAYLITGPDASVGTGETVLRGTFGASGGGGPINLTPPHMGKFSEKAYATAPAGVLDVCFGGYIKAEGNNTSVKPSWYAKKYGRG